MTDILKHFVLKWQTHKNNKCLTKMKVKTENIKSNLIQNINIHYNSISLQ